MGEREEETRKVQMTGGSTYIISLPKDWATEMKIKPGTILILRRKEDSSLQILPPGIRERRKPSEALVRVSPEDNMEKVARKVISLYLVGSDVIRIIPSDGKLAHNHRNDIKNLIKEKLIGTEVVMDSADEMTLRVLLSYPELSAKDALRRMFLVASSMQKESIEALEKFDKSAADEVMKTDNEVDRFNMYIVRQIKLAVQDPRFIKEIGLRDARDCLGYRLIVKSVERIADHAALIAEKVELLNKPVDKNVIRNIRAMSEFANLLLGQSESAVFKEEYETAEGVIEQKKKITDLEEKVLKSISGVPKEEAISIRLIAESLRRIAEYSSDIAEVVLNLTVSANST
jgi:phosphate uptake regulator